ncbi:hypothetical protein FNO01nite_03720 [Flavobacterium noncentrifugens]|nr:hypothetical protein FNO01nite_03720 [Flavobacterium noncentrifugens]
MPSILKLAVSGFTAGVFVFSVEATAPASVFGALAVCLQLVRKAADKASANNDWVNFIICEFNVCVRTINSVESGYKNAKINPVYS